MARIGRNDLCPCGSGLKFKRCCLAKEEGGGPQAPAKVQVSLRREIEKMQDLAAEGRASIRELGVFILFATDGGNAWLLEVTGGDAVILARGGEKQEVEVDEGPETIAVNWSHRFSIVNKQLEMTAYSNNAQEVCPDSPTHSIAAAIRRIRRKYSPDLLKNVHLEEDRR